MPMNEMRVAADDGVGIIVALPYCNPGHHSYSASWA